jgi:hypothetical protein
VSYGCGRDDGASPTVTALRDRIAQLHREQHALATRQEERHRADRGRDAADARRVLARQRAQQEDRATVPGEIKQALQRKVLGDERRRDVQRFLSNASKSNKTPARR